MLAVSRLMLKDFRGYRHLRLDCDERPVVLFGPNGAGKTNILEALSFLAPGRGLRRARVSEVTRREAGGEAAWAVAARAAGCAGSSAGRMVEIGTGRDGASERRVVRIDGQPARTHALLSEVLGVLWLTPAMDRLFVEGAAGRRRFLDRLVLGLDPAHARRAGHYERAMRERVRLLRDGRFDPAWLTALEDTMAQEGVAMAEARASAVDLVNEACRTGIGPFPAAEMRLAGDMDTVMASPDGAEDWLRRELAKARARDAEAGRTSAGPHRSDLLVRHAGKDMPAELCSTGEQKAVLVSIVLAQARVRTKRRGAPPILLLDEITAHLDGIRRAALYDELANIGAQSWLTGTDETLFAPLGERGQFFRVNDARVERARRP